MDRRKFLQSLALLGATAAPSAFALSGETPVPMVFDRNVADITAEETIEQDYATWERYRLGVVAVGGAGTTVLSGLQGKLPYLDRSIAIDLDPFALHRCVADQKILVGEGKNRRASMQATRQMAQAMTSQITEAVAGLDAVLIIAGMGGSAGSFLSPVVAEILRESQIVTLGAAIVPFEFEGNRRNRLARIGLRALSQQASAVVPISHETLSRMLGQDELFSPVLLEAQLTVEKLYRSLSIPLGEAGLIGVDLVDVQNALRRQVSAFGFGSASRSESLETAAHNAIEHPLLGMDRLQLAQGVLIAIEGPDAKLGFREIKKVAELVSAHASPGATVIFSAQPRQKSGDDLLVSILACGIPCL